jgi:hypothetical protein
VEVTRQVERHVVLFEDLVAYLATFCHAYKCKRVLLSNPCGDVGDAVGGDGAA